MDLKEYEINNTAVEEWLAWGGITRPTILRQKGGSCFSVIEYEIYEKNLLTKAMEFPKFRRGWAMWLETQHGTEKNKNFLVIFWNPFVKKNERYIENALGEKILKEKYLDYFCSEVEKIFKNISRVTSAKILEYQEIINFLTFSLTQEEKEIKMPEVPLYLDALLSQDINFEFKANDILVDGKKILIISLPTMPEIFEMFPKLEKIKYRYVRRILFFDDKESLAEWKKYSEKWCVGRKTMLKKIEEEILQEVTGYYWDGFIFHLDATEYEKFLEKAEKNLREREILYRIEKFNLKDVWWGSLAGMYLANITPPIVGFNSIEEIILHKKSSAVAEKNQFEKIMEQLGNVQDGQI